MSPPKPEEFTIPVTQSASRSILEFEVSVLTPDGVSQTTPSRGQKLVIGTHSSADLCLQDRTVSRFHCQLGVEEGKVVVRDLRSTNGTKVNGTPVLAAVLSKSAKITLGKTQLLFSSGNQTTIAEPIQRLGAIISESPSMYGVIGQLTRASQSDATTLLMGETGTGKDMAAHAIHQNSSRSEAPLVVVDCASLPSELIESELFGHVAGAYTGAVGDRKGAFENAQGGTILLDEIGEIPMHLQTRFLRVLDSRTIHRVGSSQNIHLDLRIIAATHRDLRRLVNEGRFREDLYHRLAIIEINIPPLRERLDDLPQIVRALSETLDIGSKGRELLFSDEFLAKLRGHDWPGNIRELRNHIEGCVALQENSPLGSGADSSKEVDTSIPIRAARTRWISQFESQYLKTLMEEEKGNVSAVARRAGVNRVHMYRLLKSAGLR